MRSILCHGYTIDVSCADEGKDARIRDQYSQNLLGRLVDRRGRERCAPERLPDNVRCHLGQLCELLHVIMMKYCNCNSR